jgi:hypothetical protein
MNSQTWLRAALALLVTAVIGTIVFTNLDVRYDLSFFSGSAFGAF